MVSTRHTPRCFYPYITHMINFTRLSSFSACNTKNIRELGDEATNLKEVDKEVCVCVCVHAKIFLAFTLAWTYLTFILGYQLTLFIVVH